MVLLFYCKLKQTRCVDASAKRKRSNSLASSDVGVGEDQSASPAGAKVFLHFAVLYAHCLILNLGCYCWCDQGEKEATVSRAGRW